MSQPLIRVEKVSKIFKTKDNTVEALKNISLDIEKGDIFGIIGMSGAGKSTLVRCLNFLERPTKGDVFIDGKSLGKMTDRQLRAQRQDVAMIFQHFNLLMQSTVIDNVCFPMRINKVPHHKARERAKELLKEVGLEDKAFAYPAQLSGGQQQRVAIARALANNPRILLCDEATSALDPKTTSEVLTLLKKINETHGITIVIITHAMSVVQEICNKVAIIDRGVVAEVGNVLDVFNNPQSDAAMRLVLSSGSGEVPEMKGDHLVRIVFTENSSYEPVVANMVLKFQSPVNIMFANTRDIGGIAQGQMVLQLPDDEALRGQMIQYLKDRRLEVQELSSMKEFEEVND
ncbi:D-methionine transport system ATP-binding protein [Butyrivibrio fibrisolvens DSM 3071]|uniref:D-methionine transport system ATP-binding protein n=1 Tax=Butyrivibrio fibrisolvens DSM 3071 TaxID=1121131 RepID=A0A1M6BBP8_BUTFI|nr:ATP-binding cassette domain-containing protein [Butyrivibrio fibrisolvens]SHI46116.1 D-methionine transport system ATP-binding protein [Butyrivibrio fibrisolvens DSM 3071]